MDSYRSILEPIPSLEKLYRRIQAHEAFGPCWNNGGVFAPNYDHRLYIPPGIPSYDVAASDVRCRQWILSSCSDATFGVAVVDPLILTPHSLKTWIMRNPFYDEESDTEIGGLGGVRIGFIALLRLALAARRMYRHSPSINRNGDYYTMEQIDTIIEAAALHLWDRVEYSCEVLVLTYRLRELADSHNFRDVAPSLAMYPDRVTSPHFGRGNLPRSTRLSHLQRWRRSRQRGAQGPSLDPNLCIDFDTESESDTVASDQGISHTVGATGPAEVINISDDD